MYNTSFIIFFVVVSSAVLNVQARRISKLVIEDEPITIPSSLHHPFRIDSLYEPIYHDPPFYPRRKGPVDGLPGHGSLDIYNNFNWTVKTGTEERDGNDNILDLALIMDCTGSMAPWIENSKETLTNVIDQTIEGNANATVRVAFIGYRDFVDGDNIFSIQDFTTDIQAVKTFISTQQATGGHDLPEDAVGALHQTLSLSWYPDSIRLAAIVTDAPTHDVSPAGLILTEVARRMKEKEIDLTLYKLNDSTEEMYKVIHQTNGDDFVGFVDLRGEIKESQDAGISLISDYVQTAYSVKSADTLNRRYKVQQSLKAQKKAGSSFSG